MPAIATGQRDEGIACRIDIIFLPWLMFDSKIPIILIATVMVHCPG